MPEGTLFEQLGGETALRAIIERFVDRLFDDLMIGYLFRAADRERVKAKEYEFAARHLGAPVPYTGRPIAEAHRAHRITGGQFMRRLQIPEGNLGRISGPARGERALDRAHPFAFRPKSPTTPWTNAIRSTKTDRGSLPG